MEKELINKDKIIAHWLESSDRDFQTMMHLFDAKDFHWSLFMGHLVIERLLKAAIVKRTSTHAPFIHDLRRLSKLSGIEFDAQQKGWLDTITTFNLNTRYDSYIQAFYKKCNMQYTAEWIEKIKTLRSWIKSRQ